MVNKVTQTVSAMKTTYNEKVLAKHNDEQVDTDCVCHEKVALKKHDKSTKMTQIFPEWKGIDTRKVQRKCKARQIDTNEKASVLKKYKESTEMNKETQY